MNVLLLKKPHKAPYKYNMIIVALLMFLFATLDVAFGLRHNLDAFIYYTGPGGPKAEFAIISYWVNVMKSADYVAQTFIGDGMLVSFLVGGIPQLTLSPNISFTVATSYGVGNGLLSFSQRSCGWLVQVNKCPL